MRIYCGRYKGLPRNGLAWTHRFNYARPFRRVWLRLPGTRLGVMIEWWLR